MIADDAGGVPPGASVSSRGFRIFNRTVNPLVRATLRSPLHPMLGGRLCLITVTGRRSGREFTIPVGYRREGDAVTIRVGWPDRKTWWHNLGPDPRPVRLRIGGVERGGEATLKREQGGGIAVEVDLGRSANAGP